MKNTLPSLEHIDRLLIVKTSSIGDVLHALPVLQALKEAKPALTIDWVVRRRCADILRGNPHLHHLYIVPDKPTLQDLLRLRVALHEARYQVALDMQGLLLSGVLTWLSGAPVRLGWDRNRECNALFLTHPVVPGLDIERHEVDALFGFAEAFGAHPTRGVFPEQAYLAGEKWQTELPHPWIALNVGASRAYKCWPAEHWAALADGLSLWGASLIFVGDKNDALTVGQVRERMHAQSNSVDLSGKTNLKSLASVLAGCDLLVSGDTGPMHLAVAVGTPVVAIFGGTDPRRHGPYGGRNIVLNSPQPGGVLSRRPSDEYGMACMRAVLPAQVQEMVQKLLDERCAHA